MPGEPPPLALGRKSTIRGPSWSNPKRRDKTRPLLAVSGALRGGTMRDVQMTARGTQQGSQRKEALDETENAEGLHRPRAWTRAAAAAAIAGAWR
eukprot:1941866-Prymnesium_polylepis.1